MADLIVLKSSTGARMLAKYMLAKYMLAKYKNAPGVFHPGHPVTFRSSFS
jgi:hypothetical protein